MTGKIATGRTNAFRLLISTALISIAFSACQPEAVQEIEALSKGKGEDQAQEEFFFAAGDYRLHYDPQLVIDVLPPAEIVMAKLEEGPYSPPHPEFAHFDLYMEQAQVYIALVDEYMQVNESAGETIAELQALIEDPAQSKKCVAELQLNQYFRVCSRQQFNASLTRLDFRNGSGLRFVTVYAHQDAVPVDNDNLLYVFQGFSDDGKYYLKVLVRILHEQLTQTGEIPADIYAAPDHETVRNYFEEIEERLEADEAGFAPKLEWIDNFISSFMIEYK